MSDKELEVLAIELRAAYFQDVNPSEEWDTLAAVLKQKWINVARLVSIREANTEYRAMYGSDLYIDPLQELMERYPKS